MAKRAILARLPFADELRAVKRRRYGYEPDIGNLNGTVEELHRLLAMAARHGRPLAGATVLEIGTGWFPVVPIICVLAGASRVHMTDLNRHMDDVSYDVARRYVLDRLDDLAARFGFDVEDARAKLSRTREGMGLTYHVPFNPIMIADGSIDLVLSRAVLEHIRVEALTPLFAALRPKMAPGAISAHAIDNSDHFEHRDKSLSRINFLTWPRWKADLIYWLTKDPENRLRHSQYRHVFHAAGYEIAEEGAEVCPRTLKAAEALRPIMAVPFRHMPAEDLAAISSRYVLMP